MDQSDTSIYITCIRRKGHQKKHVAVCESCRWQPSCDAYQTYHHNKTRENPVVILTTPKRPFAGKNLVNDILQELREVHLILADYQPEAGPPGNADGNDALTRENLLEYLQNELGRLRSLL